MSDLRRIANANPSYPPILFFFMASVDDGAAFWARLWPEARAVSDIQKTFYHAFGVERATAGQMAHPELVVCSLRAARKGNFPGRAAGGDPLQMPGLFLVQNGVIIWQHDYRHIADHPDWTDIPGLAMQHRVAVQD